MTWSVFCRKGEKLMKKGFIAFMILVQMIALIGCDRLGVQENIQSSDNDVVEAAEGQTGFPAGEIQWRYVMVNGTVYESKPQPVDAIPEGYYLIGEVQRTLTSEMPSEDFEGVHIPVGTFVYALEKDSSQILLQYTNEDSRWWVFIVHQ